MEILVPGYITFKVSCPVCGCLYTYSLNEIQIDGNVYCPICESATVHKVENGIDRISLKDNEKDNSLPRCGFGEVDENGKFFTKKTDKTNEIITIDEPGLYYTEEYSDDDDDSNYSYE